MTNQIKQDMKQTFHVTQNVGKAKYVLSYYTGERFHTDGSLAEDVEIFNSKTALQKGIERLKAQGYKEKPFVWNSNTSN